MKKITLFIVIILVVLILSAYLRREKEVVFKPENTDISAVVNPYMGFAPPADGGPYSQPHTLVYANFTWRDLEPEKGHYDFEGIEKKYKLDYWRKHNVKLIFRVVMDTPGDEKHKDIPDWLYKEINQDGTWYDHQWGKGFSPNYSNKKLIAYHKKLIEKLAERYNADPEIAFIEIGSIGHWAEFHTLQQDGIYIPFPKLPVVETYVNHYLSSFDNKVLLMRRPHQIAINNKLGLFNDMFGKKEDTVDEFWKWVTKGYTFWLTKEKFPAMPDYWENAPTGGEFAPTDNWNDYFSGSTFSSTMDQLELTHVSWLGPSSPADYPKSGPLNGNLHQFLSKIGYHFKLDKVTHQEKVSTGDSLDIEMVWKNSGVAPFYFPWPLELSLTDVKGKIVYKENTNIDIRKWLPGKNSAQATITIPSSLDGGDYHLCAAIINPETQKPGIQLEMSGIRSDGRYDIGKIKITQ
ncbi:DUF4832 domain-containing protein [Neobacillus dielmonensis]|uniref:DUF4832 domain-containing protein n=1 Tax=Neobacillus dielmonensis TaxID=1347369 RepID=UPI0005A68606|nr:DUF4832 domain-containing protein [Neobacillus dielmonensis]